MKRNKLLSWILSLVMALTVFCIPTGGAYAEENEEDELGLSVNVQDSEVFLEDEVEYSAILKGTDKAFSKQITLKKKNEDGTWKPYWGISKLIWHNADPSVAGLSLQVPGYESYITYDEETVMYDSGYNGYGTTGVCPFLRLVPKKAGDVHLSAEIFEENEEGEESVEPKTLDLTIHISDEDVIHYCFAKCVFHEDTGEIEYIPLGTEINYEEESENGERGVELTVFHDRYGSWQIFKNITKLVWHNDNPEVATLAYDGDDGSIESSEQTVIPTAHGDGTIPSSVRIRPQNGGTVTLSVDVYGAYNLEWDHECLMATVPIKITIPQIAADRIKFSEYLNNDRRGYITNADYDTQTVIGEFRTANDYYAGGYDGTAYKVTNTDIKNMVVTVKVGNNTYTTKPYYVSDPGAYRYKVKFAKVAAGTAVTVTYKMGAYSRTEKNKVKKKVTPTVIYKNQVYNGKFLKPKVTVKVGNTTLKQGTDYHREGVGKKNVGKNSFELFANVQDSPNGKYSFYVVKSYNVNPIGTSLKSLTKAKKAITVKWNKQATKMSTSRITGYQIQLATNSGFTKNKKLVTVKGYATVSKKVKKLKRKKRYYVRIRTYKIVGGTKYYSTWSKSMNVKTK
ncbi:MAG: hypothetical protein IJJ01_12405 [Firmicutes bacterium]|nr:hypothetical protein [Bacillota bacterium]